MNPHCKSAQGETEHDARSDQFEDVHRVDAGESRPTYDDGEREHANDQREDDVSPRRLSVGGSKIIHRDAGSCFTVLRAPVAPPDFCAGPPHKKVTARLYFPRGLGFRGFELKEIDAYILFFGRPREEVHEGEADTGLTPGATRYAAASRLTCGRSVVGDSQ